jgi:hypothetical protein
MQSQPSTTTQIQKVELPEWVDTAAQSNYQLAQQIAAKPYQAYDGKTVADPSQTTFDAYDYFKNTLGTGQSQINAATALSTKAGQGVLGLNRADYMNPFINDVANYALADLDTERQKALMGNSDAAVAAKAFGGSRHGVVDAITNSEAIKSAGALSAGLRKDAFDTASGLMQGDVNNMMSGAQGLLAAGSAAQDQRGKDFAGLLGIGQQEQTQQQQVLNDLKSRWDEAQGYDTERLNTLLSALGMSPYGKTENTEKTTTGGSSGTDFAQLGLGVLSLLFGLSDETMKTDIKKLGKDPKTGLPLYSYRYKGDPKTYPKVVGPMAQDVEKMYPGSTIRVGGKLAVPLGILAAATGA